MRTRARAPGRHAGPRAGARAGRAGAGARWPGRTARPSVAGGSIIELVRRRPTPIHPRLPPAARHDHARGVRHDRIEQLDLHADDRSSPTSCTAVAKRTAPYRPWWSVSATPVRPSSAARSARSSTRRRAVEEREVGVAMQLGEARHPTDIRTHVLLATVRNLPRKARPWFHMPRMQRDPTPPISAIAPAARLTPRLDGRSGRFVYRVRARRRLVLVLAGGTPAAPTAPPTSIPTSDAVAALGSPHPTLTPAPTQSGATPGPSTTALPVLTPAPTPEPTQAPTPEPTSLPPEALTGYIWPVMQRPHQEPVSRPCATAAS